MVKREDDAAELFKIMKRSNKMSRKNGEAVELTAEQIDMERAAQIRMKKVTIAAVANTEVFSDADLEEKQMESTDFTPRKAVH